MRKRILCTGLIAAVLLCGCQNKAAAPASTEPASAVSTENASEATTKNTEASQEEIASDKDLKASVSYLYKSHPLALMDNTTTLATTNYFTFEFDDAAAAQYPELVKSLEDYSAGQREERVDFLHNIEDDARGMFAEGWEYPFESMLLLTPVRSDAQAFSFSILRNDFLGGAHGFVSYSACNLDPVTGKEIPLNAVVKDASNLPTIMIEELEKQNEDLEGFYDGNPEGLQEFLDAQEERLKNDGEYLVWTLDYDGINIYFQDYSLGSYAAGSREVKILFAGYPEVFTDTYAIYEGEKELPDITKLAKELAEDSSEPVEAYDSEEAGEEDGEEYGEDWWYHAEVYNPSWSAWVDPSISTDAGTPSFTLTEKSHNTTDWLDEEEWSASTGIPLPEHFPYSDDRYTYSAVNDAENGELSLTVYDTELASLVGNFYFDQFLDAPDVGEDLFSDFTDPEIGYAVMDGETLYVSLGHRTYAASCPHKSYIVAIDTVSGNTLWKSEDQVCGSANFLIIGDSILCGYGFTDEPDYIYILNKTNGAIQKKIPVASAPSYFIPQDDLMYVLTYNTEYVYQVENAG